MKPPIPKSNLSKLEQTAIKQLQERDDIVITKADKGGATVIMDVNDYIKEAERQLNDTEYYKKLDKDPTATHAKLVNDAVERFKKSKEIPEKIADGLKTEKTRTPKFYIQPKIHKEGNPGRPVISSVECHTSNISKYVDFHLQPIVQSLPSYVKDTTDFLNKIKNIGDIPEESILVSLDVKSLYTNIPNKEGVFAVKQALEKLPPALKKVSTKVITTFLFLILTLNNFIFNCKHYLQRKGCAMGTVCAPTYANIFMGHFEDTYIYPKIVNKCKLYLRYIDDIFLIWTGTKNELLQFIEELNKQHQPIKFSMEYSYNSVSFLDTIVYKEGTRLQTKLYRKETDRPSYLHKRSEHPRSLKQSIPYSQALRIKRICSTQKDYESSCQELAERFVNRGYQQEWVNEQIKRTENLDRQQLLQTKERSENNKIPFVVTYNRTLPNIKSILEKHWPTLQIDDNLKEVFNEKPMIAFKRNKNLRDLIGGNNIVNNKVARRKEQRGKCQPCMTKTGNMCCKQVLSTETFESTTTCKKYQIRENLTCKSQHLIYLLQCAKCNLQYIGKSEWPMNIRINNHRKDVKNPQSIPVCQHFAQPDHSFNRDAKFTLIESIRNKSYNKTAMTLKLKERENFWMRELKTLQPYGLNKDTNTE